MNEQKNKAWREYLERYGDEAASNCQDVFDEGYLAALRKLFVEVKPEDMDDGHPCWVLLKGVLAKAEYIRSREWQGGGFFFFKETRDTLAAADVAFAIVLGDPPSLLDIFGRGK